MNIKLANSFTSDIEYLRGEDIYFAFKKNDSETIPFWVWLLENPRSPIPMPGKISLYNHDYLHILLGRDRSSEDEAFVVGFTMGNDLETRWYHIVIFKIFSYLIYPKLYKLNRQQMKIFDLGFIYGRKMSYKAIYKINFADYRNYSLATLRKSLEINFDEIKAIRKVESFLR